MKKHLFYTLLMLLTTTSSIAKVPTIYVDSKGVMRWSDTRKEASFYGVNYTLPFAHAYRAMDYLGIDHKAAIDRDVYHISRLGVNAYRIHLWDVEISDEMGNLRDNKHLDLFDYLLMRLKERNIRTVITAQTSFGNGYPERNQPTGGYAYLYDKCEIHQHPKAIEAQARFLKALVNHVNPYTGDAYKNDPYIVGFEINNEPCHAGTVAETKNYIDAMLTALKEAGNKKPVFYNVSHNMQVVEAYYQTAVQGTTYQWYPMGLVAGQTRVGNFLPAVDNYAIPFSHVKDFGKKARLVYEFDPADNLYSHLYPAMARSFRTAGFQWITQFTYDPIDIAYANTEYQTHYLNLAYTPNKAVSMAVAHQVAMQVKRGESFGTYPQDTLFSHARISYKEDVSEWNSPTKFYYSNHTTTAPANNSLLQEVIGVGNSPIVTYEGTGAYFFDKLEEGVWRLELMPDAVVLQDPFAKPSLKKEVVAVVEGRWDMTLKLDNLGDSFEVKGLNKENDESQRVTKGVLKGIKPGTYLLTKKGVNSSRWESDAPFKQGQLGEFVAPKQQKRTEFQVAHRAIEVAEVGEELVVKAEVIGNGYPDSLFVYTNKVSFWNDYNPTYLLKRTKGYQYEGVIPASEVKEGVLKYNLIVAKGESRQTFPGGSKGDPLGWDYIDYHYYETQVVAPTAPLALVNSSCYHEAWNGVESYQVPEKSENQVARKTILAQVTGRRERLSQSNWLCIRLKPNSSASSNLAAGFVTSDGFTYKAICPKATEGIIRVPLSELQQTKTAILPHPYPSFLPNYFEPTVQIPFAVEKIEQLELSQTGASIELEEAWLE